MADGFAALSRLIANVEQLASAGATDIAVELAPVVKTVLESEYTGGVDPSGETWAAKADGTPSHLQKSGAMRSGSQVVPGVRGVSVRIPKPGGFHQGGTVKMDARPLVPEGALPPSWSVPIETAARAAMTKAIRK